VVENGLRKGLWKREFRKAEQAPGLFAGGFSKKGFRTKRG
jgi:hypothetical protein